MYKNLMKEKLKQGGVPAGVVVQEPALQAVEILGLLGCDWILVDCEHSPMSIESAQLLVMAAQVRGMTPLVRVPQNLPEIILRYMDIGAMGVIVPNIDSAEEAKRAVQSVKYPPLGDRGLAGVRAADYGVTGPLSEYVKVANEETIVMGLIESKEGVDNIDDILAVEGFDGINIGTNDLSKSLGVPGQNNHPLVNEAVAKVLAAAKRAGKPVGAGVRAGEDPKKYIAEGYRTVSVVLNALITAVAKDFLKQARA